MSISSPRKKPKTIDELIKAAERFDQRYLNYTIHALDVHRLKERDELVSKFLSKRVRDEFCLANPYSKGLFMAALLESMLRHAPRLKLDPDGDQLTEACALVTIVHKEWARADCDAEFDIEVAKRKVRNALAGVNFVGRFEAEMYRNEYWKRNGERGKLISFHFHVIVWSNNQSYLRRHQSKIQGRFTPMLGKKRAVHMKEIKDRNELAASLVYISKLPSRGKRTVPNGGRLNQEPCKVSLHTRLHLFNEMKKHKVFDYWLASGTGSKILSEAKSVAQGKRRKFPPVKLVGAASQRKRPMYRTHDEPPTGWDR